MRQWQIGGGNKYEYDYILYLFCDWKTIWSLKYRPIDENERTEIDKIIQVRKYSFHFLTFILELRYSKSRNKKPRARDIQHQKSNLAFKRV